MALSSTSSSDIPVRNRKSDEFDSEETYSEGLTSTPVIDPEPDDEESSEDSSEEESSEDSSDEESSEDSSDEESSEDEDGSIMAAPEFPRFGELPAELRLQIWNEAAMNLPPRVITDASQECYPVPGILHANLESRTEALRHYELVVRKTGGEMYPSWRSEIAFKPEYYNFSTDIFMSILNHNGRFRNGTCTFEHKIRHLAFEVEEWEPEDWQTLGLSDVCFQRSLYPNLEDVTTMWTWWGRTSNQDWYETGKAEYPQLPSSSELEIADEE
jgi:hypothetical protein